MKKAIRYAKISFLPLTVIVFLCLTVFDRSTLFKDVLWAVTAFVIAYILCGTIHELAHWLFFKYYGLTLVELSIGVLRFVYVDNHAIAIWTPDKPFDFLCSCKRLREVKREERAYCLLSGGVINLFLAVVLAICLIWVKEKQVRCLLSVMVIACASNAIINVLNPYSTDRKLLHYVNEQKNN